MVAIPARIIAVAIVSVVGRAPVPGIIIPGRIVPGIPRIIPAPGMIVAVVAPGTVIPGVPVPGIPIGPGGIVPGAVVAAQVPGAISPGIIPAEIVEDGDVRSVGIETELRYLAFRNDDRVALRAQDVYFGFDGLLDQGVPPGKRRLREPPNGDSHRCRLRTAACPQRTGRKCRRKPRQADPAGREPDAFSCQNLLFIQ